MQPLLTASAEDAQESIDRSIESHLGAIVCLKTQRNQFSPISRLPPEVFCAIFSHVKKLSGDVGLHSLVNVKKALEWIKVSHVSTHWRIIALNSPGLWDNPPLNNAIWTSEMLKRSQSSSLSIKVDFSSERSRRGVEGFRRVLQHGPRIDHISIRNVGPNEQHLLREMPMSAPRMEVLSIHCSRQQAPRHWNSALDDTPHGLCISSDILTSAGRKLWRLELANCRVWGTLQFLPNITHLKLHDVTQTIEVTNSKFISTLRPKCSTNCRNPFCASPTITDIIYQFRHWGLISICNISTTCHNWYNVSRPSCARGGRLEEHLSILFRSGRYGLPNARSGNFPAEQSRIYTHRASRFKFFTPAFEDDPKTKSHQDPNLRLTLDTWTDEDMYEIDETHGRFRGVQCMSDIFNTGFPLDKISHIHLLDAIYFDSESLNNTIGKLENLTFIRAVGQTGNSFISSLQPSDSDASTTRSGETHFPLLNCIHCTCLEFSDP